MRTSIIEFVDDDAAAIIGRLNEEASLVKWRGRAWQDSNLRIPRRTLLGALASELTGAGEGRVMPRHLPGEGWRPVFERVRADGSDVKPGVYATSSRRS